MERVNCAVMGRVKFSLLDPKTGKVVRESRWYYNIVTNIGFQNYILGFLGGFSDARQVSYICVYNGSQPTPEDPTLDPVGFVAAAAVTKTRLESDPYWFLRHQATFSAGSSDVSVTAAALCDTDGGTSVACYTDCAEAWTAGYPLNVVYDWVFFKGAVPE